MWGALKMYIDRVPAKLNNLIVENSTFLVYIVDLGPKRLTMNPSREFTLQAILGRLLTSPRREHFKDLARVTGMLQSMHLVVGQSVRIFTKSLYDLMGQKPPNVWNWHLALVEGALSELQSGKPISTGCMGHPSGWIPTYRRCCSQTRVPKAGEASL